MPLEPYLAGGPASALVQESIEREGSLPFDRFLELALYAPDVGYYSAAGRKIGKQGDFYTSVSAGPVFGALLADRFATWLDQLGDGQAGLAEAAAHDGQLAADILDRLRSRYPAVYDRVQYWILEPSTTRRLAQVELLAPFGRRVRWVNSPRELASTAGILGYRGVLFSNELLDAMPFRRLGWDKMRQGWFEWGVTLDHGTLAWIRLPLAQPETGERPGAGPGEERNGETSRSLPLALTALPRELLELLPDGFTAEFGEAAERWWIEAARALDRGWLLAIDYGFDREHPLDVSRPEGSARAYSAHRHATYLLDRPGAQDLTASVDFRAIRLAGEQHGLTTLAFQSQEQFLIESLKLRSQMSDGLDRLTPVQSKNLQTLTHPGHLGRCFQVLIQSRFSFL